MTHEIPTVHQITSFKQVILKKMKKTGLIRTLTPPEHAKRESRAAKVTTSTTCTVTDNVVGDVFSRTSDAERVQD